MQILVFSMSHACDNYWKTNTGLGKSKKTLKHKNYYAQFHKKEFRLWLSDTHAVTLQKNLFHYLFIKIIWSKVSSSTKPAVYLPTFLLDFKVTIVKVKSWHKWITRMNNWAYSSCKKWKFISFKVVTPASHLLHSLWRKVTKDNRNINTSFLKYFSCKNIFKKNWMKIWLL